MAASTPRRTTGLVTVCALATALVTHVPTVRASSAVPAPSATPSLAQQPTLGEKGKPLRVRPVRVYHDPKPTLGDRLADRVSSAYGSFSALALMAAGTVGGFVVSSNVDLNNITISIFTLLSLPFLQKAANRASARSQARAEAASRDLAVLRGELHQLHLEARKHSATKEDLHLARAEIRELSELVRTLVTRKPAPE